MAGSTVRIREETRSILQQLARETNDPMQEVIAKALEAYRRQRFLEQANAAYAALRADHPAWMEEQEEREAWEATLSDDLEGE